MGSTAHFFTLWVSLVILSTSAASPVANSPNGACAANSSSVVSLLCPRSDTSVCAPSAPVVATPSTVPFVSTLETSPGPQKSITRKCRLLNVVYNSTNNELVRTNTLVKSGIVQIDAHPFKQWYEQFYGVKIGAKKK